ncbi:unnamed protein product [Durusdinium trenchii]|uniref:CRAL-TRIO domain-containing protein n=1 Tax=Durusdinium trenchii TaxID=1381693 RepID=A0ABP0QI23_9DINO
MFKCFFPGQCTNLLVRWAAPLIFSGRPHHRSKDQAFQNALTGSAKKAVTLYPGYSGPTVLLNLPWLARMLVSVLTPLFPGAVRDKIKFARTPMDYMKDLKDVVKEPLRTNFADDIQAVMNT